MIHIKVITLRQLIGIIAAAVLVLALAVYALCSWLGKNDAATAALLQPEAVWDVQAEDASASIGQALPARTVPTKAVQRKDTAYLSRKLPNLLQLIFGVDPTDPMSIFSHAMPGAAIAADAVIEGLDTARMQNGIAPYVTVHIGGQTHRTSLTRQNSLFSAYKNTEDTRVFVYHSHTTEAYADSTATTSAWRSHDDSQNMIGVGQALCTALETLGLTAAHDTAYHEEPNYNYAYSHSLQSLQADHDANPDTSLFIDVHRDAWIEGSSRARAVTVNGESCAQLQFVIGKGSSDLASPHWKENAALAEAITEELERIAPGITIPVRYVNARYNQHVAPCCILVEVGHNENTLQEAHLAAKYLAQAISTVLSKN